ncbi:MAG: 3-hydroxyacyl-ACP dehydratase FabZ [Myxococcota bacterium]
MTLERADIEALLPHRAPFLFLDRAQVIEAGKHATAEHDVKADAFWVVGHFPAEPIMPGVLIAEAMAQVAAVAVLSGEPSDAGRSTYLVGYDKLRFRKPVRPGDTLCIRAELQGVRRGMATLTATAMVGEDRVANGTLMAVLG